MMSEDEKEEGGKRMAEPVPLFFCEKKNEGRPIPEELNFCTCDWKEMENM